MWWVIVLTSLLRLYIKSAFFCTFNMFLIALWKCFFLVALKEKNTFNLKGYKDNFFFLI
jgi:hypothetical protein